MPLPSYTTCNNLVSTRIAEGCEIRVFREDFCTFVSLGGEMEIVVTYPYFRACLHGPRVLSPGERESCKGRTEGGLLKYFARFWM